MAIRTLIIAEARICESLLVVLRSIKGIASIDTAGEIDLGLMMLRENQPTLVFLDASLEDGKLLECIQPLKHERPTVKYIALIERIEQNRQAIESGANGVLLKGFSMAQLRSLVNHIKEEQGEGYRPVKNRLMGNE